MEIGRRDASGRGEVSCQHTNMRGSDWKLDRARLDLSSHQLHQAAAPALQEVRPRQSRTKVERKRARLVPGVHGTSALQGLAMRYHGTYRLVG